MEQFRHLRPLLRRFVDQGPPGCSLLVSQNGQVVFEDYVGYADAEKQQPIAPDTIFRIFSMTKVVTCAAALLLHERGLYLLNDPLEEYLPEFKNPLVYREQQQGEWIATPATQPIRVKDLFTMSSGLTYQGANSETERRINTLMNKLNEQAKNGQPFDNRTLSKGLAEIPLAFDPGTRWQYGLSHDVLGAFIEVLTGKTLAQFMQEEFFGPLQMRDTSFRITEEKRHRLAAMYLRDEAGTLSPTDLFDTTYPEDYRYESGGAGLLSTLSDYARFANMLALGGELDGVRIMNPRTIKLMAANQLTSEQMNDYNWGYLAGYGYGLGVRTMMDPAAAGSGASVGEFGWSGLPGTWMMVDPKEKLTAVYMQQMLPNLEAVHQPRLRNVIYGALT
ncbi:CubicO group peptidase (beta-lactamase class C family) [Paenibacillus phyllosphaerae]|uniref:CubicO group peptidase (Beta-lactamase class C family) n=1 Tax=Paenibacillus phyllosphaerae TaxID=274593 RepID=A0A7W5B454_9BACL|nr:serine hydrolase domain-containing protein [Paenibacillus phyllosphaerae]MBB3113993.1 CubicO group peptidase (beta-lactamase class C family) [Paenibacillus phyllosphaerae]